MSPDFVNLFLIGYRGAGKSGVGQLLAQRLGWHFIDADLLLERTHGKSIGAIFAEEGEASFRDKEEAILISLRELRNCVVATGGGVVLRESNRRRLRALGKVVWLMADVDTISQRLKNDLSNAQRRPDLTVGGITEIQENIAMREPLYQDCADVVVSTTGESIQGVVENLLQILDARFGQKGME